MKLAFVCAGLLLYFSLLAYAQNIQIQAIPQTVNYRENDLVIVCSITSPSQLRSVFFIQLLKNSSTTFDTSVAVATGETPPVKWKDTQLQGRASATGNVDSPSTAQLRLTIDKASVLCPTDFKMYMCKMSGLSSDSVPVTQETSPITISYIVNPTVIKMARVRILNGLYDTPDRQFPVGTVITLTCQGEVGSDPSKTIRWCAQRAGEMMFTGLPQNPIHSEASQSGCQFTRSSTITYNLTSEDTFIKFLCESGDTGMCGTGTAIQYVNITIIKPTLIEKPRVRILNEHNDTTKRQFAVGTVLRITCQGQIGSNPNSTIRWCVQQKKEASFTELAQTPIHSEPFLTGNQYIRSSTITYNLTNEDIFTRFLCESGDYSTCGSGTAKQFVNISIVPNTNVRGKDDSSDAGKIAGGVISGLVGSIIVFVVLRIVKHFEYIDL